MTAPVETESPWGWGSSKPLDIPDGYHYLIVDTKQTDNAPPDHCPTAQHWRSIDAACVDDRTWFEQHPERSLRIRELVPFEFNGPDPMMADGTLRATIVGRLDKASHHPAAVVVAVAAGELAPDVRFRLAVNIPDTWPSALTGIAAEATLLQFLRRLEDAPGFEFIKNFAHDLRERIRAKRPFKSRIMAQRSRRASRI